LNKNKQMRKVYYCNRKSQSGDYIQRPQIRLEGKWLEELGFETGRSFLITTEHGKIVIELEDKRSIGMKESFE